MEKITKMQTSLLEDSHANPGQLQELKKAAKMTETSGTKWLGLLKTYGLDGSLAKMCQALLQCQWVTEHNGSSTTPFRRGNSQADGGSTQGQNKARELEGASGRTDNEFVQTDIFDLMADTDNTRDRTPRSRVDTEQQTIEQGRADISQSEPSRQCEDVPNTESKGLEGRIHSATISTERNESTHTGDICSRERDNVADANNQGVRTRINGSDDDLPKESRGRGDERTTSTGDVGLHTKTTKNGEMELSKERNPAFRERPILWDTEPRVGRVANGVRNRVHRLRCLGNSIVPQVVARIFYAIKEAENAKEM